MIITEKPVVHEPPEPIGKSIGGINAYGLMCPYTQRSTSYCVCLHTLKAMDENRLSKDMFADCQRAAAHDGCKAVFMRRMEQDAGHALFYRERVTLIATDTPTRAPRPTTQPTQAVLDSIMRRYPSLDTKKTVAPLPSKHTQQGVHSQTPAKAPKTPTAAPVAMDMKEIVNTLMSEESTAAPRPGESVIDWVRRKSTT